MSKLNKDIFYLIFEELQNDNKALYSSLLVNKTLINDKVLIGLAEICQSIKKLELFIEEKENNYGITKLIDASKTLIDVRLITDYGFCNDFIINYSYTSIIDVAFHIILENSLIKHAHTLQYIKMTTPPKTKILSFLVNLKKLELYVNNQNNNSNNLGNIFLPSLQILKSNVVKINILRNLFVNTNGNLIKIGIDDIPHNEIDNKNIIQAIYQNCPNLMYLKLMIRNESILELEQLLINCQYLVGLYFFAIKTFDWDELFKVLTISSPTSRSPISLQFDSYNGCSDLIDLIGEYKLEGIINKFDHLHGSNYFEDFEW
ncbi:hypothetical protein GLOIN_2v1877952 [Rhizophagus irregularis DAOM 181602=DAOM 197198]|nr:hypothetical protein GLOIN_2v1877952 [Rhizophagus irregularis DAOM 181602=DAOM 197198]